ncbi:MAG: helix-turn-helix transcriptional regulator [Eubacteriales bacterium]|nr:helix-turn-helix transcriptional regulator [Eubacteriales bacterium]MDY4898257.1 helix-turn-helix transcriptional regulator [Eubacteriales bacterium]
MNTLGQRIAALRTAKNIRQNELAERLGVSSQAVSKWENDISCPDISILPALAAELGVTVDELLSGESREPEVRLMSDEECKKKADSTILRIVVDSSAGDRVRMNLPMQLVKMGLEIGMTLSDVTENETFKNIDISQVVRLAEQGLVGRLVEVDSADGDHVEIFVE